MPDGLKPLGTQYEGTKDSELADKQLKDFARQLENNPTLDGRLIEGIELAAGDNTINHLLGRPIRGWKIARIYNPSGAASTAKKEVHGVFSFNAGAPAVVRGDTAEFGVANIAVGQYRVTLTSPVAAWASIVITPEYSGAWPPVIVTYYYNISVPVAGPPSTFDVYVHNGIVAVDPGIVYFCDFEAVGYTSAAPGTSQIYDKQDTNPNPERNLILNATVACRVDLWVF